MSAVTGKLAGTQMSTVKVLTSPERRRRCSMVENSRIVEGSLQPGAMVTAVAQRRDAHPNPLHHWRRQVRQAAGPWPALRSVPVGSRAGTTADPKFWVGIADGGRPDLGNIHPGDGRKFAGVGPI